jgi:hypothetical protein
MAPSQRTSEKAPVSNKSPYRSVGASPQQQQTPPPQQPPQPDPLKAPWVDRYDPRMQAQIASSIAYTTAYADAGVPGHTLFLIIAQLASDLDYVTGHECIRSLMRDRAAQLNAFVLSLVAGASDTAEQTSAPTVARQTPERSAPPPQRGPVDMAGQAATPRLQGAATERQVNAIYALGKRIYPEQYKDWLEEQATAMYQSSVADLTKDDASNFIDALQTFEKAQKEEART